MTTYTPGELATLSRHGLEVRDDGNVYRRGGTRVPYSQIASALEELAPEEPEDLRHLDHFEALYLKKHGITVDEHGVAHNRDGHEVSALVDHLLNRYRIEQRTLR